jgi:hypothetical protein
LKGVLPQWKVDNSICAAFRLTSAEVTLSACTQCLSMCMFQVRRRMLHLVFLSLLVSLFMLAMVWLCQWYRSHHAPSHSQAARRSLLLRRLKPRSPLDCPACCLSSAPFSARRPEPAAVRPWREVKSRRGSPKQVQTAGFACPNRACQYYGISDADIHAASWRWSAWSS